MTKTEREFVTELNANMPEFTGTAVEVQKKIAMYIYLKIGKSKAFDEKWFLGNQKQREKIEKLNKKEKNDIDVLIKKRKLVCITLSSLYNRILKDFGINSKVEKLYENDAHCSNIITFDNGEKIVADLQRDLDRIHTRSRIKYFGQEYKNGEITGERISDKELSELHKSCGYIKDENDYMDEKITQFSKKVEGMEASDLLEQIVTDQSINSYPQSIGYIELYKFYSRVVHEVAPKYDKVKIHYCNCYRVIQDENGQDTREYSMCMYSCCNNKIKAYLYSNKEKKFKVIDLEAFPKLEKEGLCIGKNPQENGVKLLRKHINKTIEENIKRKYSNNYNNNIINYKEL